MRVWQRRAPGARLCAASGALREGTRRGKGRVAGSSQSIPKLFPGSDFRRKGWTAQRSEGVRKFGHGD